MNWKIVSEEDSGTPTGWNWRVTPARAVVSTCNVYLLRIAPCLYGSLVRWVFSFYMPVRTTRASRASLELRESATLSCDLSALGHATQMSRFSDIAQNLKT